MGLLTTTPSSQVEQDLWVGMDSQPGLNGAANNHPLNG